eukprot:4771648-Prymnesium_polylepis.1
MGTVRTNNDGGSSAQKLQKEVPFVFRMGVADFSALGERRAAALRVFERKSASAIDAAGTSAARRAAAE